MIAVTWRKLMSTAGIALLLAGCNSGGGTSGGSMVTPTPSPSAPTPTPTPTVDAGCTLRERQDWAGAQLREWYLFPETLPASLDPAPYGSVDTYIDALTANARALNRDRYFTYLTSIKEENAYYEAGASAGYGFRLTLGSGNRLYIAESFEGTPALAASIDRGAEITAIGTSSSNLRAVSTILASEGTAGLIDALGPDTVGTTRWLRVIDAGNTASRDVAVAKAEFELPPVSSRYGAKVIADGGRKVGYINLRSFISTADPALRSAFADFKAQGVTDLIIDLRYNGGGLISTAQTFGDLLGGARTTSDVQMYVTFRPEKSSENETRLYASEAAAIAPTRIAFIGTNGTASASELVINATIPYLHANTALIGTNTYGKPVGQIALDRDQCDDRLRVVALATENSAHQGAYYNGLAGTVEASCQAGDDLTHPMGDPAESSTRAALDFIAGRSCTRIGASAATAALRTSTGGGVGSRTLLTPDRPSTLQRETPGAF